MLFLRAQKSKKKKEVRRQILKFGFDFHFFLNRYSLHARLKIHAEAKTYKN